ncbi:MAG: tryptophan synthase subunit alpha [Phycisphaerales bacterium]
MGRIDDIFGSARGEGRKLLMPFVCAGSPTRSCLPDVLMGLERGGASIVEVGFPFSDPIADGPVIAAAMHAALSRGTTPAEIFEQVRSVRDRLKLGLVAMVSVSLVDAMGGAGAFCARAAEAGFDGLIVPDCPLEESSPVRKAAGERGLTLSLLVAPTTPETRAAEIARACTGFVYLLARAGVTGERDEAPEIESRVAALRQAAPTPIACGFGISTADQVRAVTRHADAAIVGTALVRRLGEAGGQDAEVASAAEGFCRELAGGLA